MRNLTVGQKPPHTLSALLVFIFLTWANPEAPAQTRLIDSLEFDYPVFRIFPDKDEHSRKEIAGVELRLYDDHEGRYQDRLYISPNRIIDLTPSCELLYFDGQYLYMHTYKDNGDTFRFLVQKYRLDGNTLREDRSIERDIGELVTGAFVDKTNKPGFVLEDGFEEGGSCAVNITILDENLNTVHRFQPFPGDSCAIDSRMFWDKTGLVFVFQNGIDPSRIAWRQYKNFDFRHPQQFSAMLRENGMLVSYGLFYAGGCVFVSGAVMDGNTFFLYCFDMRGREKWRIDPGTTFNHIFTRPDGDLTAIDYKSRVFTINAATGEFREEVNAPKLPGWNVIGKNTLIAHLGNKVYRYQLFGDTPKILPADETEQDAALAAFVGRLQTAIEQKDTALLFNAIDPGVLTGKRNIIGLPAFKKFWRLDDPDLPTTLWERLRQVVKQGGVFAANQDTVVFPYAQRLVWDFPGQAPASGVVTGSRVNLRTAPNLKAKVLTRLSYELVKFLRRPDGTLDCTGVNTLGDPAWFHIRTLDGKYDGWIYGQYVFHPESWRLIVKKQHGTWKISAFITGA